jgi:hypothetical protein
MKMLRVMITSAMAVKMSFVYLIDSAWGVGTSDFEKDF